MSPWNSPEKILCIRPDNMGDVLMSSPAIRALKESFNCSITLLTSSMGRTIAPYLPAVDEYIIWDAPWVKGTKPLDVVEVNNIIDKLKQQRFDAAVIFTVFSQNPLPTAMLASAAEIPRRLAYCRENPYHLLTHWIPDEEPYEYVRHQVRRDLDLVRAIGADTMDDSIIIKAPARQTEALRKLTAAGLDIAKPWLVLHPGVSEIKRQYPAGQWIHVGKKIDVELGYQMVVTGVEKERPLAAAIAEAIGHNAYNLAGAFSVEELISLIGLAPLLVSVNTGTVHIASAMQTPVIVLYALTNPQHAPWKCKGVVLPFSVADHMQSRNAVLRYVQETHYKQQYSVSPDKIFAACQMLLGEEEKPMIGELVLPDIDAASRKQECPELQ
jgi:lipopolysaccharide heptosyltransferase II